MNILLVSLPFIFLLGWTFYSVRYVRKALNDYSLINPIILDNIPTVFSTLGVFGTFLGISIALFGFNVNDIDGSIPELLNGLKVAFLVNHNNKYSWILDFSTILHLNYSI